MASRTDTCPERSTGSAAGFSLAEMMISVLIITLVMSAVFAFMAQAQKRYQGNIVVAESNQAARAALELMTQEIGQAGYNPQFYPNKTMSAAVNANSDPQCVTLNNITGINRGDFVIVDTGVNNETVQIGGITGNPATVPPYSNVVCATPGANQIYVVFQMNHTATPIPVASFKFPYATGMIAPPPQPPSPAAAVDAVPYDHLLRFFGDVNQNGIINYVVYSLSPTTSPATTVTISNSACTGTFTLYNLYRSITPVTFAAGATNTAASPLAQNVLLPDITATYTAPTTPVGPTCQPLFSYPSEFTVGIVPSQITVVGTIVVTISVAVNPKRLESGIIEWYTMATQIRPLNLAGAVMVNQAGGGKYMSVLPAGLPMADPVGYYQ